MAVLGIEMQEVRLDRLAETPAAEVRRPADFAFLSSAFLGELPPGTVPRQRESGGEPSVADPDPSMGLRPDIGTIDGGTIPASHTPAGRPERNGFARHHWAGVAALCLALTACSPGDTLQDEPSNWNYIGEYEISGECVYVSTGSGETERALNLTTTIVPHDIVEGENGKGVRKRWTETEYENGWKRPVRKEGFFPQYTTVGILGRLRETASRPAECTEARVNTTGVVNVRYFYIAKDKRA